MTVLETLSEEEFLRSYEEGVTRHAGDMVQRGLWAMESAEAAAREDMTQLLPQGGRTQGFVFLKIVDEATGERVGETWYSTDVKGGRTHFWVHWIGVDPQFRRKGHARQTLEQLAARAREAGADRMGLHVLADNTDALSLYARLGFSYSSHRMSKRL